jgi:hypothetical protein
MAVSLCTNLGQTCRTHQVRRDGGDVCDCLVAMNVGNTNACRIWRDPADCAAEKSPVNSIATTPRGRRPASQFTTAGSSAHGRKLQNRETESPDLVEPSLN